MAKLYNLAGMTTTTTGTGTITLGSAIYGHLTFAQAGIANNDTVTYAIKDGENSEIGRGVYTSSGTTLTRTVLRSTNSNAALNLSGSAEVFITPAAEDFNEIDAELALRLRFDAAQSLTPTQQAQAIANLGIVTPAPPLFNLLDDAGRFAGSPEPKGPIVSSFVSPGNFAPYNGAVFSQGHKYIFDNTTYGGTAGALGSDALALIDKLKSTTNARRYSPEWYVLNIAVGAGTDAALVEGGVTHYLVATNTGVVTPARFTLNFYVRCLSGSAAINVGLTQACYRDALLVTGGFLISDASGWVQVTNQFNYNVQTYNQYSFSLLGLYASPGSQVRLALPTVYPGHYDVTAAGMLGCVASLRGWR